MKKIIPLIITLLLHSSLHSQLVTIQGKVINEDGGPVPGATIRLKVAGTTARVQANGRFSIQADPSLDSILVTAVGFKPLLSAIPANGPVQLVLQKNILSLEEVVLNTGYQQISPEKATGAFDFLKDDALNRRISTDLLSRLENMSVVFFDRREGAENISIRGRGTIFSGTKPLIVVDNFPYDGDLDHINPNDIETVTILKDAAAASVWGAFAANGVLVIKTKKGNKNQAPVFEFTSNLTVTLKPDLYYSPEFMPAPDFIGVERMLFNQGYYNNILNNTISYPIVSPVVEILARRRNNQISPADSAAQIGYLEQQDIRRQFKDHFYRNGMNQQYNLNYRGGSDAFRYYWSLGFDHSDRNLVRNSYERVTIRSSQDFHPGRNWELNLGLTYTGSTHRNNNKGEGMATPQGKSVYPYMQLIDNAGVYMPIPRNYRLPWLDTAGFGRLLDWHYRPLEELALADNKTKLTDVLFNTGISFRPDRFLQFSLRYQFQKQTGETIDHYPVQSYMARNLINMFTLFNGSQTIYQVPNQGILDRTHSQLMAHQARGQVNYQRSWNGVHELAMLGGVEWRENETVSSSGRIYGYDSELLSYASVDYVNLLNTYNNVGSRRRIASNDFLSGRLNRFLSAFANGSYTYLDRYSLSASMRKDASNIFGVHSNQKWVPLWSAGLAWHLHNEPFYKLTWLPRLKIRLTYGFNGLVDNSLSALPTISYYPFPGSINNLTYARVGNPPNPELRWEKSRTINTGLDFASKKERISGSIDFYWKRGKDLIGFTPVDLTTGVVDGAGFYTFKGNVADMSGKGIELNLHTINTQGKIKWKSRLLFNHNSDKVTRYGYTRTGAAYYVGDGNFVTPLVGRPVLSILSYRWAGLDPLTGNPRGYDPDKNPSTDYSAISNADISTLEYNGPALPTVFGALEQSLNWNNLTLSINLSYKFGHYFRRSSIEYLGLYSRWEGHSDYALRWQQPGDELFTNVPSQVYPANSNRDVFYSYSSVLVEKGDHIRLQDISLSYLIASRGTNPLVKKMQIHLYLNNLGIIWRANDKGLDPDYPKGGYPLPRSFALGIKTHF